MDSSSLSSLVVLALTAALSPFSLIAFALVLTRGPRNGFAFICGWITAVMLIGVAVTVLGSQVEVVENNTAGRWTLALELALGVVLLGLWVRRELQRRRGVPAEPALPKPAKPEPGWQRRIGTMGVLGAFVVGGLVQTWPVMIAGGAEISRLNLGPSRTLTYMALFALATTAALWVLEVLAIRNPEGAVDRLDRIRAYVERHRDRVLNTVFLVGGLWLFFRGLIGLLG